MSRDINVVYTNHRGETRARHLRVISLWYGKTEWHPEEQWLLKCQDLEDGSLKDFALLDFHGRFVPPPKAVGNRCPVFIKGEQCALEPDHAGKHMWGRGD